VIEHAFDAIAVLVVLDVASDRLSPVRSGRDDRQDAVEEQALADVVTVIALSASISLGLVTSRANNAGTAS